MLPLKRDARYGRIGARSLCGDSDRDEDDSRLDCRRDFDAEPPAVKWLTTTFIRCIPVLATLSWLGTLLALLGLWTFQDGRARLASDGSLSSIASIGASHRLTFLFGAISTAVFYSLSLVTERFLRTTRVLTEVTDERYLWVAVGCADVLVGVLASASLVLLAVFDTVEFPHEHDILLIAFFVCVIVSGLLQMTEVERLWHEHPDRDDLREGAFLKAVLLAVVAASGLGFWVLSTLCGGDATAVPYRRCYRLVTASATCQWLSAFTLAAYLSTLILDLWPVARHAAPVRARAEGEGEGEGEAEGEGEGEGEGAGWEDGEGDAGRGGRDAGERRTRGGGGGGGGGRGASGLLLLDDDGGGGKMQPERAELLVELGRTPRRTVRRGKEGQGGRASGR